MIVEGSGSQFDPDIVAAFVEISGQFEAICHGLTVGSARPVSAPPLDAVSAAAIQLTTS